MKNKERLTLDILQGLLVATVIAVGLPMDAFAQAADGGANLGEAASDITSFLGPVAPVISGLFWLGGAVMMGAGALKLKDHAENPTQTPVRQGISRMAVGAILLTLPFFAQFAVNTLSAGSTAVTYTSFTNNLNP